MLRYTAAVLLGILLGIELRGCASREATARAARPGFTQPGQSGFDTDFPAEGGVSL